MSMGLPLPLPLPFYLNVGLISFISLIRYNLPRQQSEQAATVIIVRYVSQVNLCVKSDVHI